MLVKSLAKIIIQVLIFSEYFKTGMYILYFLLKLFKNDGIFMILRILATKLFFPV